MRNPTASINHRRLVLLRVVVAAVVISALTNLAVNHTLSAWQAIPGAVSLGCWIATEIAHRASNRRP
jgi:hypothetical protein